MLPKNPSMPHPSAGTHGGIEGRRNGVERTVFRSESGFLGPDDRLAFVSVTFDDSLEGFCVQQLPRGDSFSLWTPTACAEIF